MADINTANEFIIGSNGAILGPLLGNPINCTTKQQAFRVASWSAQEDTSTWWRRWLKAIGVNSKSKYDLE